MTFASKITGMLSLASSVVLLASAASSGCIATDTIEFVPVENFPPSIVSEPLAEFPLNEIGKVNLDDPVELPAVPLQVNVRDPNFDQTLEYRIFLDAPEPPAAAIWIQDGEILPTGFLERPSAFFIPYELLTPGECHKIELVVVGMFASNVEERRPVEPGDIDEVTWWIEVTDADEPISQACR